MDAKVLLCDFAEVSGGKLFITGAGLSLVASATPTAPYRVNLSLALLGLIGWEDTDVQHRMTIELVYTGDGQESRVLLGDQVPEGGDPGDIGTITGIFMAPKSPAMEPNDEWTMPMAIPFFGLGLPQLGSYYFTVRIDGREMDRTSFRVLPPQPPQMMPEGFGAEGSTEVPGTNGTPGDGAPGVGGAGDGGAAFRTANGEPPL